jgi:hypothetical protein
MALPVDAVGTSYMVTTFRGSAIVGQDRNQLESASQECRCFGAGFPAGDLPAEVSPCLQYAISTTAPGARTRIDNCTLPVDEAENHGHREAVRVLKQAVARPGS